MCIHWGRALRNHNKFFSLTESTGSLEVGYTQILYIINTLSALYFVSEFLYHLRKSKSIILAWRLSPASGRVDIWRLSFQSALVKQDPRFQILEHLSAENCSFEIIQVLYEVNIIINLKRLCFFTTVSEYVYAFKVSYKNVTLLKGYKVYTFIDHMQLCTLWSLVHSYIY